MTRVGHLTADQQHQVHLAQVARETRKPAQRQWVLVWKVGKRTQTLHDRNSEQLRQLDDVGLRAGLRDLEPDRQHRIFGFEQHSRGLFDALGFRLHAAGDLEHALRQYRALALRRIQILGHLQEHRPTRRGARHLDRASRELRHPLDLLHLVAPLHERIQDFLPVDQFDVAASIRILVVLARTEHD